MRLLAALLAGVEGFGKALILLWEGLFLAFRPPWRWRLLLQQMEFIGAGSLFIVLLTGVFTGMVFAEVPRSSLIPIIRNLDVC